MKVLFLFGPNLGALGRRDPETYGSETLEQIMRGVEERGEHARARGRRGVSPTTRATSSAGCSRPPTRRSIAVVINPGALAHYSYALRDAIEACGLPVIEVHMSNIDAREEFRRHSVVSEVCRASIIGLGAGGYHLALEAMPWITT